VRLRDCNDPAYRHAKIAPTKTRPRQRKNVLSLINLPVESFFCFSGFSKFKVVVIPLLISSKSPYKAFLAYSASDSWFAQSFVKLNFDYESNTA
jgi:hypothetical protein